MTNELDEARAREAERLWDEATEGGTQPTWVPLGVIAARLARENWTPPEPVVDPDLLAFREWIVASERTSPSHRILLDRGHYDNDPDAKAYVAGARMAREQEQERAKGLVEYVEAHVRGVNVLFTHSEVLAKYRGEV